MCALTFALTGFRQFNSRYPSAALLLDIPFVTSRDIYKAFMLRK
ncbi:hypothetical protein GEI7407_2166 [Geitlerinema sp. PCC 7407]|nr:hypothetical protein GEI7407_2166 [Geitlerinema sp. PCC 7407]